MQFATILGKIVDRSLNKSGFRLKERIGLCRQQEQLIDPHLPGPFFNKFD
jgi:hypothetical protein